MPEIKISLGLNRAQFGSLGTSSSIAWWTSTMVAGYLGDKFSNRAGMMLAAAMSLMGGAFYLMGIARSAEELKRAAEEASVVGGVKQVVSYVRIRDNTRTQQAAPTTQGTPRLRMPAFSPAIAASVSPRNCW